MPIPLGSFISRYVYDKKLQSVHHITDLSCVAFIDAAKGVEESQGKSWVVSVVSLVLNVEAG